MNERTDARTHGSEFIGPARQEKSVWVQKGPCQPESTFQELFKYEIRCVKSLAVVLISAVTVRGYFGLFWVLFPQHLENTNFARHMTTVIDLLHYGPHFMPFPAKSSDRNLRYK